MYFKGTIIITDPLYFIKDEDLEKTNHGIDLEIIGLKTFLNEESTCGTYTTYDSVKFPKKLIEWLIAAYNLKSKALVKYGYDSLEYDCYTFYVDHLYEDLNEIGEFFIDSGRVGVFLLEEIVNYNPSFKYETKHCIIPNFDGEIEYYIDTQCNAHFISMDSYILTLQTGY